MDFENIRMDQFLRASVPVRFQDVSPFDFEDFIAHLFYEAGCEVEQTDYTGDFGADMVIVREGVKTVVQVKRYRADASVGVHDLNQVIAAQKYYNAEKAMIVATTGFTTSALKVADQSDAEVWDWERLLREIEDVFLDGEDIYAVHSGDEGQDERESGSIHILPGDFDVFENRKYHALVFELENSGVENVLCRLEMPVILTKDRKQLQAVEWIEGYFSGGHIYSGARVEVGCLFLSAQIDGLEKGDRVIQRIYYPAEKRNEIVQAFLAGEPKGCGIWALLLLPMAWLG